MTLTSSTEKLILRKQLQPGDSSTTVRLLGIIELLGAMGIAIPLYTKIITVLTSVAAAGFCIVMIGKFFVRFKQKEYKVLPLLVIVFIASFIVAIYRF